MTGTRARPNPAPPGLVLFHTSEVHVPGFSALAAEIAPEIAPGIAIRHVVRADLLRRAIAVGGLADEIREAARAALRAEALGAGAVLCTCSTLGPAAEDADRDAAAPILRIDRAMADRAVARARRIAVVACIEATLGPTAEVVTTAARAAGKAVETSIHLLDGPWRHFEAGDLDAYHRAVAAGLRGIAPRAEIILLAQASMAPAAMLCADLPIPVLSSPRPALEAALRACRAASPDDWR